MIGNDIVDLSISHVGSGHRRERYIRKLFTDSEILLLDHLGTEDRWIWLLWSIKESVYKIIAREERRIRYAPKTIVCFKVDVDESNRYESVVMYNGKTFKALSSVNPGYIHTIAFNLGLDIETFISKDYRIPQKSDQLLFKDAVILDSISAQLGYKRKLMSIQRDDLRIPHLILGRMESGVLSISGDGDFFGFVYVHH